jgi:transketolase
MGEIKKQNDSRRTFIDTLIELANSDSSVCLIVPDVGFLYIEEFKDKFPTRFYNFGVTEASCLMIAVGMAKAGLRPFVYSMINFVLFRPAEMVRNGIVCHKVPVVLLGVSGSESYKFLGFSHNLLHNQEDIIFCNNIGLQWSIPSSNEAVRDAVCRAYKSELGMYIRL